MLLPNSPRGAGRRLSMRPATELVYQQLRQAALLGSDLGSLAARLLRGPAVTTGQLVEVGGADATLSERGANRWHTWPLD